MLGAVLGGLLGSSCCAVQLGLNAAASAGVGLSLGCAGFNKTLGPLRPLMRGLTAAYFAWLWARALFSPADVGSPVSDGGCDENDENGGCGGNGGDDKQSPASSPRSFPKTAKAATVRSLALSTAMCAALTFLPELLLVSGGPALAASTAGARHVSLSVSGMGCEACQAHVRQTLLTASGAGVGSWVCARTHRGHGHIDASSGTSIKTNTLHTFLPS